MAQKSRVISANNLLESENYQDAKEAIDLAVINPKTSDWHRTYLVKGLLCQKAFEAGFVSAAHGDDEISATLNAASKVLATL